MNKNFKLLVVEDDNDINNLLKTILCKQGYEVDSAFSGTEATLLLKLNNYDLILLDLMLPGINGEEVIKKIRQKNNLPIIVLSAKGAIEDKINALGLGADDYITKPFERLELLARVSSQLRRYYELNPNNNIDNTINNESLCNNYISNIKSTNNIIIVDEMKLNIDAMSLNVKNNIINLTAHEYKIIQLLFSNPNKVYSKDKLYELIWENNYYGEDNTVSVHVSNIRKKISKYTDKDYIKTIWGIGYKLNV